MTVPNRCTCPLCLEPDAAELRLDKRGRPYVRCGWCESTMFIRRPRGLTSLTYLAPHAAGLLKSRGLTVRGAQAEAERKQLEVA